MNFSEALNLLKQGKKLSRSGWNKQGMYVKAQFPDGQSKMKRPYLYIVPSEDWQVPWVPGMWDLFSDDWFLFE